MTIFESEVPEYYQPGASLHLRLSADEVPLTVNVLRVFTPFTMAQVVVVELAEHEKENEGAAAFDLPDTFILKIYDPRFYSHRIAQGSRPARPWTLEAEAKAAALREEESRARDPDFEPWMQPEDDDEPGWEEWYYQNAESQYHSEVEAYKRLQSLQGGPVPRQYTLGVLQLEQRALNPHVLVLEYIQDAKALDKVEPESVPSSLLRDLLDAAEKFGQLGVVHTDLNPGNVLFSLDSRPMRAAIIDFGESGVREEEEDAEWDAIVLQNADATWMRKRLEKFLGAKVPRDVQSSTPHP